jgi:hypothetical protein
MHPPGRVRFRGEARQPGAPRGPVPFTVEPVRSGDPPIRHSAATDQSSTTPGADDHEDIDADASATAVPPTDGTAGERHLAGGTGDEGQATGRDDSWPGDDRPWPGGAGPGPGDDGPGPGDDGPGPGAAGSGAAAGEGGGARAAGEPEAAAAQEARTDSATETGTTGPEAGTSKRPAITVLAGFVRVRRLRSLARQRGRYAAAGGAGFARLTVLPAILLSAWLLVGLPLLMARAFLPAPMLLISVPVAIALVAGLRRVPVAWPRALPGTGRAAGRAPAREPGWSPWWGLAGTVAVAAGFALWQFLFNSESVIVLRDPGAYLQTGYWIAQHGSLPIPQSLAAFGGPHPGLAFSSTGFFADGTSVVPGVMSGLPLVLAGAFWVHGTAAAAAMGPILGGLAVLAFGGLTGRLAGPRWAPAGAIVLALTLPEQYTSRASFSETAAQVLLFGGLSLVADALTLRRQEAGPAPERRGPDPEAADAPGVADAPGAADAAEAADAPGVAHAAEAPDAPRAAGRWRRWLRLFLRGRGHDPQWALMALGGLALGLSAVVRFDGLLDILPAIPFLGILVIRRSSAALPLGFGLAIGAAFGLADAYLLARPFINSLRPLPELIGLIAAWFVALTVAGVELMRLPGFRHGLRKLLARRPVRWLPEAGGVLAVAGLVALAVRPYLQTVRGPASGGAAAFVASLQRLEHLPVDPGRLYAEDTLYWVIWYVGLPAVLLGGFGVALLVRRFLRALFSWQDSSGAGRIWALPLAVICCGSVAVLWQPQTAPDQPWASRRLVPLMLPGLILCAIWASAWLRDRARSRGAGRPAASAVAVCCVAALLVPTVATTFGLGVSHSGPSGALKFTANGLALKRTAPGEVGAVDRLCSSLGPAPSVVIVDRALAQQFTQVIRGMCGVPVAWLSARPSANAQAVLGGITRAGRRAVLLGSSPSELTAYGGSPPVEVINLSTSQDPHTLTQPPTTLSPAHYVIWMTSLASVGARV